MDEEKFNKICENVKDTRYSVERTEGIISDIKRNGFFSFGRFVLVIITILALFHLSTIENELKKLNENMKQIISNQKTEIVKENTNELK